MGGCNLQWVLKKGGKMSNDKLEIGDSGWIKYLGDFEGEHSLIVTREVTPEEQDLIFKIFICEFMGWTTSEYVMSLCFQESSLAKRVYDALKCE